MNKPVDIDTYLGKKGLVLIFAPSVQSPAYELQLEVLNREVPVEQLHDVVFGYIFLQGKGKIGDNTISEEEAAALRQRFGVDDERFIILIFNVEGTEVRRDDAPLQASVIFEKVLAGEPDLQN